MGRRSRNKGAGKRETDGHDSETPNDTDAPVTPLPDTAAAPQPVPTDARQAAVSSANANSTVQSHEESADSHPSTQSPVPISTPGNAPAAAAATPDAPTTGEGAVESVDSQGVAQPHTQRQPKPRPKPLAFPDDTTKEGNGMARQQYGTFVAPPALAADTEVSLGASSSHQSTSRDPLLGGDHTGRSSRYDSREDLDEATAAYLRQVRLRREGDAAVDTADMGLWEYLTSPQSPLIRVRDHCHHQWVAVLFTVLLLGLIFFLVFGSNAPQRATGCNSDFGVYLGEHNGVAAYSNCRYAYSGDGLDHFLTVGLQRVYSGSKWHALEYARRYWTLTRLLTFPSLQTPDQLFNVTHARVVTTASGATATSHTTVYGNGGGNLKKGQELPLLHFHNLHQPLLRSEATRGAAPAAMAEADEDTSKSSRAERDDLLVPAEPHAPRINISIAAGIPRNPNGVPMRDFVLDRRTALPQDGDLLVYEAHRQSLRKGHVAVVVGVQGPFRRLEDVGHRVLDSPKGGDQGSGGHKDSTGRGPYSPDKLVLTSSGQWRYSDKELANEKKGETKIASTPIRAAPASEKKEQKKQEKQKHGRQQQQHQEGREDPFAYKVLDDEEPCVFYRVYLAEQNWNNRGWLDIVKTDKGRERQVRRGFSRVVLLKEYYPSRTFYLQDNSGQRILGWVRPPL